MTETKIKDLLTDEKLLKEFLSFTKMEDAENFLKDHGIESSREELKLIADMLNKYEEKGDFLNDTELENIVGGRKKYYITKKDAEEASDKLNESSKNNLICSEVFAGLGLCAGVAAYLTDGSTSGISTGVAVSSSTLALYKLIKSGQNKYDASWWKSLANSLS